MSKCLTTIPRGSRAQANGARYGSHPNNSVEGVDIVWSAWRHAAGVIKGHPQGVSVAANPEHKRLGVPYVVDGVTKFATADMIHKLSEGRWGFCIDELPQAAVMMQNALAGLALDRQLGDIKLSNEVVIVATGNRTQDKAGANRMVTQLGNRLLTIDQESSLDGWCDWAIEADIPMWLVSFMRFRPAMLNDFDPNRMQNPTERTWEMVGRLPDMPDNLTFTAFKGLVGEGAAAEATSFKAIADKLPSMDAIRLSPATHEMPTNNAVLYALSGAIAYGITKDTFGSMYEFISRMPAEFQVLVLKDCVRKCPSIAGSSAFVKWASKNAGVLV